MISIDSVKARITDTEKQFVQCRTEIANLEAELIRSKANLAACDGAIQAYKLILKDLEEAPKTSTL